MNDPSKEWPLWEMFIGARDGPFPGKLPKAPVVVNWATVTKEQP